MENVRFGVIGCGNIGRRHAEQISRNKRAKLKIVCDIVKEKADELAKKYGAKAVYSFEDALKEDVDVLNICTPSGLHAEMSIAALKSHKNVLCEKPMCLSLTDAEEVVKAEKESKKKFFLVKQNRYNPPIKLLKESIYDNKLGKIIIINCNVLWNRRKEYFQECDWRGTMKLDGGALMTQCSHFLDLMIWIGGKVDKVFAKMGNLSHPYIETEDTGFIIITFADGCIGSLQYTTSVYEKNMEGSMTVLGTEGSIKVGGAYINELDYWNVKATPKPEVESGNPPNEYAGYKGSMSNHDKVIENVVSVLLDGEKVSVNSMQGKESVEVMQAAYISALTNKEITLPLKGENHSFRLGDQPPFSGHKKNVQ